MKVIAIIPAKDEQDTIGAVLQRMPNYCTTIVVDDGSEDKTAEIAKSKGVIVMPHRKTQGVGAAFKTGLIVALRLLNQEDGIIITLDADGQMNPDHIPYLIKPILDKQADVVIVTRFKNNLKGMPWIKRLGNKICTFFVKTVTKNNLSDTQCGFRAYSKEAAKKINIFGKFTYTQEVIMDLADKGQKIIEVSLPILPKRSVGKSKVVKNFFDYGVKASAIMLRSLRDYNPLKFFGIPGMLLFLSGFIMDSYVIISKLFFDVAIFEHNTWKLFFGSLLLFAGLLCIIFALLADMYSRHRKMMEEILYLLR